MAKSDDISPLDPIQLTEQAVFSLRDGDLAQAVQYLMMAKSQITDSLAHDPKNPIKRVKAKDLTLN